MSDKQINYQQALSRIENIVDEIENDNPDVDQLSAKVKEALELLQFCKDHLKNTEEDLNQTLEDLE